MISLYLTYYIQVELGQTKKISESMETSECQRTGYLNPFATSSKSWQHQLEKQGNGNLYPESFIKILHSFYICNSKLK